MNAIVTDSPQSIAITKDECKVRLSFVSKQDPELITKLKEILIQTYMSGNKTVAD